MKHEILPTIRVVDADTVRGYRIINASDFDSAVHETWPPAVEVPADTTPVRRPKKAAATEGI